MTPFECPSCGRTVEVCTAKATVSHLCPAKKPRPTLVQFRKTEASALSR